MTLFRTIAATALAGLAALGSASAASAHHLQQQSFNEGELQLVFNALAETGHRVFYDQEPCGTEKGLMGAANGQKQLLVCAENHKGDLNELADTVRHEALHLVQFCKGRSNGATSALIVPDDRDEFLVGAINHLHMPADSYPASQHYSEAEARVLAHALDEGQVAALLRQECGQ